MTGEMAELCQIMTVSFVRYSQSKNSTFYMNSKLGSIHYTRVLTLVLRWLDDSLL